MAIKEDRAMSKRISNVKLPAILILVGLILILSLFWFSPSQASEPKQQTEEYCLSCHSNTDLKMTLPSGEVVSLYIDPAQLQGSVHSPNGIECEACHTNITSYPHPEISYQTKRELTRQYYQACQKCHPDNYSKTLDSMHAQVAEAGNLNAPVCTDCHGSHYVKPPDQPRTLIPQTCGNCHTQEFGIYQNSVHGNALIQEANPDVPVCTTCHGVHNIQDPRTQQFKVEEPDLCASCHANEEMMAKYGLSADVYSLYNLSWHGVDVSVYEARWPTVQHNSAVCTDCHGIHDILKPDDPNSSVNPANLLVTCQKCHPGVSPNWTGAWTGHYKVSLERSPFLYYLDLFYSFFTPAILIVCGIYVILQFIRFMVDRARRSL
ncbi:MAG: cytochrome C [Anaerolineales bacterium]|nr:cytochrome C [Anaerolineae bacterium]PWB53786.1 MAG: cytochrome C [Anaerolineales bacterium]